MAGSDNSNDRTRRVHNIFEKPEVITEPGQSVSEYMALYRIWEAKLKATGFSSIESISDYGASFPLIKGKSPRELETGFHQGLEEYYRLAGLFAHHFDFKKLNRQLYWRQLKYFWVRHAEGMTLKEIHESFATGHPPLVRKYKHKPSVAPSVFYIHQAINNVLLPAFNAWVARQGDGVLRNDPID